MAHLIELVSYEKPDLRITLRRSSIEEVIPVSEARTDIRFESGRSVAVAGDYRQVVGAVGTFIELAGEREGSPHLINPESIEQVEQSSEGWCMVFMKSGRSYYVKGDRMAVSLKIELAGAAVDQRPATEPGDVITADFVGHARLKDNFPTALGSRAQAH